MKQAVEMPVEDAQQRIPLSTPDLRGREMEYLARCVSDNWVSSAGPFVAEMERRVAEIAGIGHAVATSSGSAALHLMLVVAGVRPGDRVVVPDWTFIATANAVRHAGAEPVLVDVAEETWTLDPALVADLLSRPGHGIAAVVAVHALGLPADMDALRAVCEERGVRLLEDAAGALGATYKGRAAGALGDAAVFSFNGNKTVTTGGGGMIVTGRANWAERARHLSTQARDGAAYSHDAVGFNCRMTNVNAAIGLAQLERLSEMLDSKKAIARRYDEALASRGDLRLMPRAAWADHSFWLYSVRCADAESAAALVAHLAARGIEARQFWQAISRQAPYGRAKTRLRGVSERLSGAVVCLPSSSHLLPREQERVLTALGEWAGA